jgi:hypothetical protein
MKAKGWMGRIILFATLLLLVLPAMVIADTMIKQATSTDAFEMMGQKVPARTDTSVTWLTKGMSRMDQGDTATVIMLMEKNLVYMIDHNQKSYMEMPLDALGNIEKMMGIDENDEEGKAQLEMMKGMMSMMQMKVTVNPTEETEKIRDWNCTKYLVSTKMGMGSVESEIWATEDPELDFEMFLEISQSFKAMFPGFKEVLEEMKKIKGIAVMTDATVDMMGTKVHSTTEVIEIAEKSAPEGTYNVPKGYEKTEGMPGLPGMKK